MHAIEQALAAAVVAVLVSGPGGCSGGPPPAEPPLAGPAPAEPAPAVPAPSLPAGAGVGDPTSGDAPTGDAMKLTCEVYCSETELRTARVRLSWIGPGRLAGPTAAEVTEELQATVFKGGFDRDLFARIPVRGEAGEPPAAPDLPALDLEVVEVVEPSLPPGAGPAGEDDEAVRTTVEIEGLEPGTTYTWRVVVETAGGREVSETVTCVAPVCTADFVPGGPH